MMNFNVTRLLFLLFCLTALSCSKEDNILGDSDDSELIIFTEPPIIKTTDLLFTGSSTFEYWTSVDKYFHEYTLINTGKSGTNLMQLFEEKENRIFMFYPKYFVFYYGDNDMYSYDIDTFKKKFKRLMKEFTIRRPKAKVILLSIKPAPLRIEKFEQYKSINQYLKNYEKINASFYFIDIWTPMFLTPEHVDETYFKEDRLHPSEKGYELIGFLIKNKLQDLKEQDLQNMIEQTDLETEQTTE